MRTPFSIERRTPFTYITIVIFCLCIYNILYKFTWKGGEIAVAENLWNPIWLLFGPLLFIGCTARNKKLDFRNILIWLHFVPFFIAFFTFLRAYVITNMSHPWETPLFVSYQNNFYIIFVSLIIYGSYLLIQVLKTTKACLNRHDILVIVLSSIFILIGIVTFMFFLAWGIVHFNLGMDYRFFTYGLLGLAALEIVWYWNLPSEKNKTNGSDDKRLSPNYKNSALSGDTADELRQRVVAYFENEKVYLKPDFSLNRLSRDLKIPKHNLSQLFNIHFEKSFHSFTAGYRIRHAIQLLNENQGRLTIESLAYSCGFNSKSSFNKYFKEFTGESPSEFQIRLGKIE